MSISLYAGEGSPPVLLFDIFEFWKKKKNLLPSSRATCIHTYIHKYIRTYFDQSPRNQRFKEVNFIILLGKEEEVERGLVEFLEQLGFIHGIFLQKRTNIICGIDFKLVHTNYSREDSGTAAAGWGLSLLCGMMY